MKEKLLISACLLGVPCRYDGREVPKIGEAERKALCERYELIPVCPEIYGGLPTPRVPSERVSDKVLRKDGADVTAEYRRGAEITLSLARTLGATKALLKEKSPSCGCGRIYDGTFSGSLIEGNGVTAELLLACGVEVFGESELQKLI